MARRAGPAAKARLTLPLITASQHFSDPPSARSAIFKTILADARVALVQNSPPISQTCGPTRCAGACGLSTAIFRQRVRDETQQIEIGGIDGGVNRANAVGPFRMVRAV